MLVASCAGLFRSPHVFDGFHGIRGAVCPFRKALAAGGLLADCLQGGCWLALVRPGVRRDLSCLPPPLVGGGSGFQPREGCCVGMLWWETIREQHDSASTSA